ncbi:MAG: hypothetical protein ACRDQA_26425, partial [Nocardioidaceae bacterium]
MVAEVKGRHVRLTAAMLSACALLVGCAADFGLPVYAAEQAAAPAPGPDSRPDGAVYFRTRPGLSTSSPLKVRPRRVIFGATGHQYLTGLVWRHWGGPVAKARGTAHIAICVPSCAEGKYRTVAAALTLSRIAVVRGKRQYACYSLTFPNTRRSKPTRQCLPGAKNAQPRSGHDDRDAPSGGPALVGGPHGIPVLRYPGKAAFTARLPVAGAGPLGV